MVSTSRLSRRRSRRTGLAICSLAALLAAAFALGLWNGSYWALAIPVSLAVLAALGLAFSIGWTIATVHHVPPQAEPYTGRASRWAAWGICAASALLAPAFLWGLVRESYWALALPVALAVLGLLAMVFRIGWAVIRRRNTLPLKEARERAEEEADRAATGAGAERPRA